MNYLRAKIEKAEAYGFDTYTHITNGTDMMIYAKELRYVDGLSDKSEAEQAELLGGEWLTNNEALEVVQRGGWS
jgi:hypothetical protein